MLDLQVDCNVNYAVHPEDIEAEIVGWMKVPYG